MITRFHKTLKTFLGHVAFITLYIANETTAVLNAGTGAKFWDFALFFVADILLFYVLSLSVLALFSKGSWHIVIGIALVPICWLGFLFLYDFINEALNHIYSKRNPIHFNKPQHYWNFYRSVFITFLAILFNVGRINAKILKEKLMLTNAVLQAQIKPHFLFNSLNSIYNTIDRDPTQAKQAIIMLSDMMRNQLKVPAADGLAPIQDELDQIRLYLSLNQLQHPKWTVSLVTKNVEENKLRLPPSLLLSFVENMYKHGFLSSNTAKIELIFEKNHFRFHTENEIRLDAETTSFKIGNENARKRLTSAFKKEFQLTTQKVNDYFILDLSVRL